MRTSIFLLLALASFTHAQENTNSKPALDWAKMTGKQRAQAMMFTTPAYRKEALRLVIEEANRVARELNLSEQMPITESNLMAVYISPPRMTRIGFGNITTSNYTYYMTVGDKFSYLEQAHARQGFDQLRSQYLWPMSRRDTNSAYQVATQALSATSMDVAALNSDCDVHVDTFLPEGVNGKHFVPVYWIYWTVKKGQSFGPAATVELFAPTKTIRQLRVNKSEYILRKPLEITNLDSLLSQTNTPPRR
jgi:hypothetical protein